MERFYFWWQIRDRVEASKLATRPLHSEGIWLRAEDFAKVAERRPVDPNVQAHIARQQRICGGCGA